MDKNEKLWFSAKKSSSYHNILWSEEFKDTRCCGQKANKIPLLFKGDFEDDYRKFLDVQEELIHS